MNDFTDEDEERIRVISALRHQTPAEFIVEAVRLHLDATERQAGIHRIIGTIDVVHAGEKLTLTVNAENMFE
jgi:hypothetical protein